jgi:catechol 2,3-dioxygenase-like lactoylglutathione lyase family enzyme
MMHTRKNSELPVAEAFDRILIAVADLEVAKKQYQALLGVEPDVRANAQGVHEAWIGLKNTVLVLYQSEVDAAAITGLVLRESEAEARIIENALGLDIEVCDGCDTDAFREGSPWAQSRDIAVDHLVLRTQDADACIDLFSEELGVRLALDKTAPQWGGRMLFFRAGKMTLEVIEAEAEANNAGGNYFWGIAFQHANLDVLSAGLGIRGVTCSAAREGRKPGTRVATVKSHCLELPTLLIEPVKGAAK